MFADSEPNLKMVRNKLKLQPHMQMDEVLMENEGQCSGSTQSGNSLQISRQIHLTNTFASSHQQHLSNHLQSGQNKHHRVIASCKSTPHEAIINQIAGRQWLWDWVGFNS